MGEALSRSLGLLVTLDPRAIALLAGVCAIGELAVGVPYVLESVWLLVGYYLGVHALPVVNLLVLWSAAQAGRQAGSVALYYLARSGADPLARLFRRFRLQRFVPKRMRDSNVMDRMTRPSAFSVAFSRLLGLRVPVALMSALRQDMKTLLLGVLLSSLVWDGIYIAVGLTVGTKTALKPADMLGISIGGLTVLYLLTFGVRRLVRYMRASRRPALG